MRPAAFSLGSNLGDRERNLLAALDLLGHALGPLEVASIYETQPVSPVAQPDFLNTAAIAISPLSPEELLALARAVEDRLGRTRVERWGPRVIDVDLLLVGDEVRGTDALRLPHPRLAERRFVLEPLCEIAPALRVPPVGRTVRELLDGLADASRVSRVAPPPPRRRLEAAP